MISKKVNLKNANQAFVWVWLPGKSLPVVAGSIVKKNKLHYFTYGHSYREREDAIALSPFELPLKPGTFVPEGMNTIHSCLRDASPDAWGRRLIDFKNFGINMDELDYMLLSGSDRIGALDFQLSSSEYLPREVNSPKLEDLINAVEFIEHGQPLPMALENVLFCGTSIGGARPKSLIYSDNIGLIAKFGLSTDTYNVIKAEYIAMKLAQLVGLRVPNVFLRSAFGKDVILIERFDRVYKNNGVMRKLMLSGLSLLGLNELEARYASYSDLADIIRQRFSEPKIDLLEMYKRLVFNILIGNTDDHARNHSAFWDGKTLELTPAYDICPQARVGQEASQAMMINGCQGNLSRLVNVLSISESFQLEKSKAYDLIANMIAIVEDNWVTVCNEADLSKLERKRLWHRAIFNPFCFQGWNNKCI